MDRRALVLYLKNVRDLEILKLRIEDLRNKARDRFYKDLNDYPTVAYKPSIKNEKFHLRAGFYGWSVVLVLGLLGFRALSDYRVHNRLEMSWEMGILTFVGRSFSISLIFCSVVAVIYYLSEAIDERRRAKEYNRESSERYQDNVIKAKANQSYINKRKKEWDSQKSYYEDQYFKADSVLQDFYDMNIIPDQFRGAAGACYLYNYMSSSNESFQMALISNQIEVGIQRIEARLDYTSQQLSEILYQQRVIRDENRIEVNRRIESDKNMLNTLKAMESRQSNIEEYSRLSANYNEAAALFSMATYLKTK